MWIPANYSNIRKGTIVRFVNKSLRKKYPLYDPPNLTIGEVTKICEHGIYKIQWPKDSTSDTDEWYADYKDLEVFVEN